MKTIKRFLAIVLIPLFFSDICSYIKLYVENKDVKIFEYWGIVCKTSAGMIYNYATIYFIILSGLYFLFNYFKPNYEI